MTVYEAVQKRRSIRKFEQKKIAREDLLKLVDCARLAAYGANIQPLKFAIIDSKEQLDAIFPYTKWAGYLQDGAPKENERPAAYIAILGDKLLKASNTFEVEAGSAAANIMLEAVEMNLGSCWLGAIDRDNIKKTLKLPENMSVVYLIALGYPAQKSQICEYKGDVKYFEDENKVINVPKRSLDEIIINI